MSKPRKIADVNHDYVQGCSELTSHLDNIAMSYDHGLFEHDMTKSHIGNI